MSVTVLGVWDALMRKTDKNACSQRASGGKSPCKVPEACESMVPLRSHERFRRMETKLELGCEVEDMGLDHKAPSLLG